MKRISEQRHYELIELVIQRHVSGEESLTRNFRHILDFNTLPLSFFEKVPSRNGYRSLGNGY